MDAEMDSAHSDKQNWSFARFGRLEQGLGRPEPERPPESVLGAAHRGRRNRRGAFVQPGGFKRPEHGFGRPKLAVSAGIPDFQLMNLGFIGSFYHPINSIGPVA
uniref:Uncharacterized protein n=1 Tax=Ananas comosus var. bracteatus TaxID=296719 RepID=A0A6V7P9U6_ANACO|nr:unnamed protein product [Ananas comosus var. bracteatus]